MNLLVPVSQSRPSKIITADNLTSLAEASHRLPNGVTPFPPRLFRYYHQSANTSDRDGGKGVLHSSHQAERLRRDTLPNLLGVAMFGISIDAGAGHHRPLSAICSAIEGGMVCVEVTTLTSRTHYAGSQLEWAKIGAQYLATHQRLQNFAYAPVVHEILIERDSANILAHIEPLLKKAVEQGEKEVLLIHTNPDPAFIAGYYKYQLEKKYGVKLTNVVVITDHFITRSQCIWNLIDVDIIVAPDRQTQLLTERWLRYWERKMRAHRKERGIHIPEVVVCGYPQDLSFQLDMIPYQYGKRAKELAPGYEGYIDVAIPLGGGSPGMPYLTQLAQALHTQDKVNIWTVYKKRDDPATVDYEAQMKSIGATVEMVTDNGGLINAYAERFRSPNIPTIVIVKPGELSNQMIFAPNQVGGAIFLFVEPVGDQEVQNKLFFQSDEGNHVLPSDEENDHLVHLILELMKSEHPSGATENHELHNVLEKAHTWRGLSLPKDANDAALFIHGLKQYGVLQAMTQYQKIDSDQYSAMSDTGSTDFFRILDGAYGRHISIRDKIDKINQMKKISVTSHSNRVPQIPLSAFHG